MKTLLAFLKKLFVRRKSMPSCRVMTTPYVRAGYPEEFLRDYPIGSGNWRETI